MLRQRLSSLTGWRGGLAIATASVVAPVLATRYPPFTDAPEHAAVMATLRHWADPAFSAPYRIDALHSQYFLYHLVGAAITFVVGDAELANRVLLALVGIAFPLSFAYLLRAARRDRRLAVFACLPFLSRALVIGFLPFVASIPLTFVVLGVAIEHARRPTRRRAFVLSALALLVFYAHVSAYTLLVLSACAWTALGPRRRLVEAARPLLWLVPSALVAVGWALTGSLSFEGGGTPDIGRMALRRSIFALPMWLFDVWRSHGDEVAAGVWWAAFALAAILTARSAARYPARALLRLYAPFACAVALYIVTPYRVGAAVMLNVRFAPVLVLFAVLAMRLPRRSAAASVAVGMVTIATVIGGATAFVESRLCAREELGDFDRILAAMPKGSRLVSLHFAAESRRTHLAAYLHAGAYHRVRSGGVASFSFAELGHWPVRYRPDARPPAKSIVFWDLAPCEYKNTVDGAYYDFVLVRGPVDPFARKPPGPVFRRVVATGPLTLYAKDAREPWTEGGLRASDGACDEQEP